MKFSKKEIHKDNIPMDKSISSQKSKDNTNKNECVIENECVLTEPDKLLSKPIKVCVVSPQKKMSETKNYVHHSFASGSRDDDAKSTPANYQNHPAVPCSVVTPGQAENSQPALPFTWAPPLWSPFSGISRTVMFHESDNREKPVMKCLPMVRLDITNKQAARSVALRSVKYKLPGCLLLPNKVLELIRDDDNEIKYVIDYYYKMAKVVANKLVSYIKTSCKRGRILYREDFHFLTKKFTTYILYKGLIKKRTAKKLRIDNVLKHRIANCLKSYFLKFGDVYRPMSYDLDPTLP